GSRLWGAFGWKRARHHFPNRRRDARSARLRVCLSSVMSDSPRGLIALSIGGVRLSRRGWAFVGASIVSFVVAYAGGRQELVYVATLLAALPLIAVLVV